MALRFSRNGPCFPGPLLDSLMDGEVVFLCGAGISVPQLPNFSELVERTCEELNFELVEGSPGRKAFDNGRFEEVLGALHRRLENSDEVIRVISSLLEIPENPCIERHHTLLQLSCNLENKICIVTTNFDTLLERATAEIFDDEEARRISSATQALPLPGSLDFSGIMHIHGRLADQKLALEESQLILTSADYSDAYMRPGWASRFLFDLARCKTIVLVGYSANDIPVRYFLNGLEVERGRFPDIKPVYAFHAQDREPETASYKSEESQEILPVNLLPYCKINPDSQDPDHMPLWRDLKKLAEAVEHQAHFRRDRTRTILHCNFAESDAQGYEELDWLFGKPRDIQSVPFNAISDPDWFEFFYDKGFWSESDLIRIIAIWVAKDFQNVVRFKCAIKWQNQFERPFTEAIQRFLRSEKELDETWTRVWRLFCLAESARSNREDYYAIKRRFASSVILDSDLRKAVELLSPKPAFRIEYYELLDEISKNTVSNSRSLLSSGHMDISDSDVIGDLLDSLRNMPEHSLRILEIATLELQSALALQAYFVQNGQEVQNGIEYDPNDWQVPSIEDHEQNQLRGGINFLIRAIMNCVPQAKKLDLDYTRAIILGWKRFPGRIGLRLCLHAMRDDELFSGNDAMSLLLSISIVDFWSIDREIPLLLRDQAGNASPKILRRVERRIIKSGASYYKRFLIEQDQDDWRRPAHDAAVWIHLKILQKSTPLSEAGIAKLSAIVKRRGHLNREVEDQDIFGFYISEVRKLAGDPTFILNTPKDDRRRVVHEIANSPNLDVRESWSAFCKIDPQEAFNILSEENFRKRDSSLWVQFISNLVSYTDQNKEIRKEVSIQAMNYLYKIDVKSLQPLAFVLCGLISFAPREKILNFDNWLLKLWKLIEQLPDEAVEFSTDMYQKAINLPAGELSLILLIEIQARKDKGLVLTPSQRGLIGSITANTRAAGYFGCCVFAFHLAFLFTIERKYVIERLVPRIKMKNNAGAALRDVMLRGTITPEISNVLKEEILTGVMESSSDEHLAEPIVANIFRMTLAILEGGDQFGEWNLTANDMRRALRGKKPAIRRAVLNILVEWLLASPEEAEAWDRVVVPFFRKVWPKERKFANSTFTRPMIDLVIAAGRRFPEALEFMRPYIRPYSQGRGSLLTVVKSDALQEFPKETLDLVWLVCGPRSRGTFYELSDVLDRLIEIRPKMKTDRRLQWLRRQVRHDGS